MVDKTTSKLHQMGQSYEIKIVDPISNNFVEDSLQIKVEAVREGMAELKEDNSFLAFNIYKIRM